MANETENFTTALPTLPVPDLGLKMHYEGATPTLGDMGRLVQRLLDKKFPQDTPIGGYSDGAGVLHLTVDVRENL